MQIINSISKKNLLSLIALPSCMLLTYIFLFLSGFIGFDSSVFIYGGMAIHSQELDILFWDNKGPFLYLINYFSQILHSPYGFYILEGLFVSAALLCSNFLLRQLIKEKFIIYSNFLFFLTYLTFFDGGNFTETYQLGLNLICFSIFIHFYFYNQEYSNRINLFLIFIIGFSISIGLMMRPNNILGLSIAAIAVLIFYKQSAVKGFAAMAFGLFLPIALIINFHSIEQLTNFYHSYIEYNFLTYSTTLDPSVKIKGILMIIEKINFSIIMIFLFIIFFALRQMEADQPKHNKLLNIFALIFFFDLISQFVSGYSFNHYLLIPITSLYFFTLAVLISKEQVMPKISSAILFFIVLMHLIPASYAARSMAGFYKDGFNNPYSKLGKLNHTMLQNIDITSRKILIIDTPQLIAKNKLISPSRYVYTPLFKSEEFQKQYAENFINDFLNSEPDYILSPSNRSFLNQEELSLSSQYKLARNNFEDRYQQVLDQDNYEIWQKVL